MSHTAEAMTHTHIQSFLDALPTIPSPGVFTRKRASLILSGFLTCPVYWSRRLAPLLREWERGLSPPLPTSMLQADQYFF